MENLDCRCSYAYFCPEDNQWEPEHTCEPCQIKYDQHMQQEDEYNCAIAQLSTKFIVKPLRIKTYTMNYIDADAWSDDLPF